MSMRRFVPPLALLALMFTHPANAAPLDCESLVSAYDIKRDELGIPFGAPSGQDIFQNWSGDQRDYRYQMDEDLQVEVRLVCAADGLFQRFTSSVSWVGEPDVEDWMLAQTPADIAALAVRGDLGPDIAALLGSAFDDFNKNRSRGYGESSEPLDEVYEVAARFEVAGTLQIITYFVRRSEIE